MAIWPSANGDIMNQRSNSEDVRTGLIEYFVSHVSVSHEDDAILQLCTCINLLLIIVIIEVQKNKAV